MKSKLLSVSLLLGLLLSGARADWSFVMLGDTRGNDNGQDAGVSTNLNAIAQKIASLSAPKPSFVLVNGDLISGELIGSSYADFVAQFNAWKTAMNPVQAANIPIYPVRGNHENEIWGAFPPIAELKQAYYDLFGTNLPTNGPNHGPDDDQRGFSYAFTHSNVTIVAVDQYFYYNQYTNLSPQNMGYHSLDQAWVEQQLQATNTPFKMVMVHEPAFISTGQDLGEQFFGTEADGLQRRADFWTVMGTNGCRLYVCGHVHGLSVASVADAGGHEIIQLMTGNGGAAPLDTLHTNHEAGVDVLYANGTDFGFALATVSAAMMTIEYYLLKPSDGTWSEASYTTRILPNAVAPERPAQIFFQEPEGLVASWLLATNGTFQAARLLGSAGAWQLMTAGDVDGDGVSDLLFQNVAGDTAGCLLNTNGATRSVINWGNVGAWKLRACADYTGEGHAQIFFQNPGGLVAFWRINTNGVFQSAEVLVAAGGWRLSAAIPHATAGLADLYWQNAAGLVAVWQQQPGGGWLAQIVGNTGPWALCGAVDMDDDGVGDLLLQTAGGDTAGWFMRSNNTMRSTISWWNTGEWELKAGGR